jgi:hypothetical protein
MRGVIVMYCLAALAGCGGSGSAPANKAEQPVATKAPEKPIEPFRRFPKENLVQVRVVEAHLMGKPFLPAGSVAEYRRGANKYSMFVAEFDSPAEAAIALLDYKNTMTEAKLVPAFGGYFGKDGDQPAFVFTKGRWIAGVTGLGEKQADLPARQLASAL